MPSPSMIAHTSGALIHVVHDNPVWFETFRRELTRRQLQWREWIVGGVSDDDLAHIPEGQTTTSIDEIDFNDAPPPGVYFNRTSASAHTRGKPHAAEHGTLIVDWLEAHGRRVLGGSNALRLEMSKAAQERAFKQHGIATPTTRLLMAHGGKLRASAVQSALSAFPAASRLVVKPSRGGSGAGVRIFADRAEATTYLLGPDFKADEAVDGVFVVQEYIDSPDKCLYRLEFVSGKLVYGVRVDTADLLDNPSEVNNCPADSCDDKRQAKKAAASDGVTPFAAAPSMATFGFAAATPAAATPAAAAPAPGAAPAAGSGGDGFFEFGSFASTPSFLGSLGVGDATSPPSPMLAGFTDPTMPAGSPLDGGAASAAGSVPKLDASTVGTCPLAKDASKFVVDPFFAESASADIVPALERMLVAENIDVCGIEIVQDASGKAYVIDMNCVNSNYNTAAERKAGLGLLKQSEKFADVWGAGKRSGAQAVVDLLVAEVESQYGVRALTDGVIDDETAAADSSAVDSDASSTSAADDEGSDTSEGATGRRDSISGDTVASVSSVEIDSDGDSDGVRCVLAVPGKAAAQAAAIAAGLQSVAACATACCRAACDSLCSSLSSRDSEKCPCPCLA